MGNSNKQRQLFMIINSIYCFSSDLQGIRHKWCECIMLVCHIAVVKMAFSSLIQMCSNNRSRRLRNTLAIRTQPHNHNIMQPTKYGPLVLAAPIFYSEFEKGCKNIDEKLCIHSPFSDWNCIWLLSNTNIDSYYYRYIILALMYMKYKFPSGTTLSSIRSENCYVFLFIDIENKGDTGVPADMDLCVGTLRQIVWYAAWYTR